MAAEALLVFVILFVLHTIVDGRYDVCFGATYNSHTGKKEYGYIYCSDGCCGSYYDRECCSVNVRTIVGAVVGVLICIGIIVTVVIIVICYKKKQSHGMVHALPLNQGYVSQPIPPPSYPGQAPPPPYINGAYPPPQNPAPYPPPPPHRY